MGPSETGSVARVVSRQAGRALDRGAGAFYACHASASDHIEVDDGFLMQAYKSVIAAPRRADRTRQGIRSTVEGLAFGVL